MSNAPQRPEEAHVLRVADLGVIPYDRALAVQHKTRDEVLAGGVDTLLLLEHEPVVTRGKRGGVVDAEALRRLATPVVDVDRGGQATWHGPGQLVGYPIMDLRRRRLDVPTVVARWGRLLETVARALGVAETSFDMARPGIYARGQKLGAIGLHIHRGVTTHGFALNVNCSLEGFDAIVACGMPDLASTTVARAANRPVDVSQARRAVMQALETAWSPLTRD